MFKKNDCCKNIPLDRYFNEDFGVQYTSYYKPRLDNNNNAIIIIDTSPILDLQDICGYKVRQFHIVQHTEKRLVTFSIKIYLWLRSS